VATSAIIGALAAGTATLLGYHCYAPTSQLYGRTLTHCAAGELALTFDDGPNGDQTRRLLDLLAKQNVRATFFLIGRHVVAQPDVAREIAAGGHEIGNHTFSHPNLLLLPGKQVRQELVDCLKAIADAIGNEPALFRPPYGARRTEVLRIAAELGLRTAMWSVTCYDWKSTTAERVEAHAVRQIGNDPTRGDILLMHDGGHRSLGAERNHTLLATERLIARYRSTHRFRRLNEI
jgi:peptidoglycan/xylan/chitin deacetylase (PgdA/CDA1 family)